MVEFENNNIQSEFNAAAFKMQRIAKALDIISYCRVNPFNFCTIPEYFGMRNYQVSYEYLVTLFKETEPKLKGKDLEDLRSIKLVSDIIIHKYQPVTINPKTNEILNHIEIQRIFVKILEDFETQVRFSLEKTNMDSPAAQEGMF